MPEARAGLWVSAFNRILEHPFIGHGPFYAVQRGIEFWYWPHNGYLYVAHLIGFIGLAFYLLMLALLWRLTWTADPDLGDRSYARAFLVIGNAQLLIFMVDQLKIDYLRNPVYTLQVWLMFAMIVAANKVARTESAATPPRS